MRPDKYIYKALTGDQWDTFQADKIFKGSAVDLADGYIPVSYTHLTLPTTPYV